MNLFAKLIGSAVAGLTMAGAAYAADPIKIALVQGLSGSSFKVFSEQSNTGFQLGLEYATKGTMMVRGRPIEVIIKDTQFKPDVARAVLAEAYGDDGVLDWTRFSGQFMTSLSKEPSDMRIFVYVATIFCALILSSSAGLTQSQNDALWKQIEALPWQSAPNVGRIGQRATVRLNNDLLYLDSANTSRFVELMGNPPMANRYVLAPSDISWFAVFTVDETGYIKDDEKIDPDQLLETLKRNNEASIKERRRLKLPILRLEDWSVVPHYDLETKRLEWGTKLSEEDGSITVNYSIRILGRRGVVNGVLVSDAEQLSNDIVDFKSALKGFEFNSGEKYSEYRSGDKLAKYGLGALIAGGAAAAVVKSGAGKTLFKFLGIGVIFLFGGLWAFIKNVVGRRY